MTKKYFKLLLSLGVILCILCTSFTMSLAAPQWGEFEGEVEEDFFDDDESTTLEVEEDTTEETTRKETKPTTTQAQKKPTTTVSTTERTTQKTKETTKKTTEKTTKAETTQATTQTNTETTDEDEALLKDGQFFVYLERNNGERRLKTILDKPGLVPQPNMPIRKGYIFKGWYKDAKFTEAWDFGKSIAEKGTVIYAKWEAAADTVEYKITVEKTKDGIISVNPGTASAGEVVIITVKPDSGKRLVAGSITINGKHSDVLSFIMPEEEVVVGARFEDVPQTQQDEKMNPLPIIIVAAVLLVIAIVVVIIIVKYKNRPAILEYDENGAIILDDDDDDRWIDDSIVIEAGFANGKIVRESVDADDDAGIADHFETEQIDD